MSTGTMPCCRKKKVADSLSATQTCEYQKLGLGVNIYLKQLKSLVCLFFICSLISVPSFILYYYGGDTTTVKDSKTLFSTFTLGNIG